MISERSFARSFDSFWQELPPLLTPRFVAVFNEAYEVAVCDPSGRQLSFLQTAAGVERPDIVAEFGFQLARSAQERGLASAALRDEKSLVAKAEKEAFELIQRYEGGPPAGIIPLTEVERSEGLRLCERYEALYAAFPGCPAIEFCPRLRGAGFLNSSEGDIGIGDSLIEVKTTTRKPSGRDIRQLITYMALDANAETRRWSRVAIFNPRRGTLHRVEIDSLVLRLSGGKPPSDVFAELIGFAESNEPTIERKF
jgi:hypothetical protein